MIIYFLFPFGSAYLGNAPNGYITRMILPVTGFIFVPFHGVALRGNYRVNLSV